MFHKVCINPNDCDVPRFLWWPDNDIDREREQYQIMLHPLAHIIPKLHQLCSSLKSRWQSATLYQGGSRQHQIQFLCRWLPQVSVHRQQSHWTCWWASPNTLRRRIPFDKIDPKLARYYQLCSYIRKSKLRKRSRSAAHRTSPRSEMECGVWYL